MNSLLYKAAKSIVDNPEIKKLNSELYRLKSEYSSYSFKISDLEEAIKKMSTHSFEIDGLAVSFYVGKRNSSSNELLPYNIIIYVNGDLFFDRTYINNRYAVRLLPHDMDLYENILKRVISDFDSDNWMIASKTNNLKNTQNDLTEKTIESTSNDSSNYRNSGMSLDDFGDTLITGAIIGSMIDSSDSDSSDSYDSSSLD